MPAILACRCLLSGVRSHRPGRRHRVPVSTYRLQLTPDFGFAAVAAIAPYLADLGITDVYLSPILESSSGSTHGYDVVSHAAVSQERGGRTAFDAMVAALAAHDLAVIADVVPNHMTIPTPVSRNAQFWSVLREGEQSPHAHWFDVDWHANDGRLLLPVLGAPLETVLARGELTGGRGGPSGTEAVLRYFEHEFPVRPDTENLPLPALLDVQPYRLAHWREGADRLNYRRFFDVTTLAGIRVEEPDVFYRSHALLLDLTDTGAVTGLRVDHPDGLADPGGYLGEIARATGQMWVAAEKILEGDEDLPEDWECAGTTGYDALRRVAGLFTDPAARDPLTATYAAFGAVDPDLDSVLAQSKRDVVDGVLDAEVQRLVRVLHRLLPEREPAVLHRVLAAMLVSMDRYRVYLPRSGPADAGAAAHLRAVADRARAEVASGEQAVLDEVLALALGRPPAHARADAEAVGDFVIRFQQTCGPVMAKGVEDTAFYRYQRLVALNEVGGDPGEIGLSPNDFHEYCARRLATWPTTMTTLSTHDTKRSEDARARLLALSEYPHEWAVWVHAAHDLGGRWRDAELDPDTEYRLWQEVIGAWPLTPARFGGYATKAIKEAKRQTSWAHANAAYETAVARFATGVPTDPATAAHVASWLTLTDACVRANTLGQKLIQLTMPGVADTYQGCELVARSLVDPDNRRPVNFARARIRLARLDAGGPPGDLDDEKLSLTARALRLRRERPGWFVGPTATYAALDTGTDHLVGFARGDEAGPGALVLATRLYRGVADAGGWHGHSVALPPGRWRDTLGSGGEFSGALDAADLLAERPVALLVRAE